MRASCRSSFLEKRQNGAHDDDTADEEMNGDDDRVPR